MNTYLKQQLELINNQICFYQSKAALIERFNAENPNADTNTQHWFMTWVNHSNLSYEEIMQKGDD